MRAKWGTDLTHEDQEFQLTRYYRRAIESRRGLRERTRIGIHGKLKVLANSVSELAAKTAAIEQAYAVDGKDFVLLNDDGSESHYVLRSSHPDSITGVRVLNFEWIHENPTEIVNNRTAIVHLESDYFSAFSNTLDYFESVRYVGTTGRRWRTREFPQGDPVDVVTHQKTVQHVIQSGYSLGLTSYVEPTGPLFPDREHQDLRVYEPATPKLGNYFTGYGLRWAYYFSLITDSNATRPTVPFLTPLP